MGNQLNKLQKINRKNMQNKEEIAATKTLGIALIVCRNP
jgi:hypothetical protein